MESITFYSDKSKRFKCLLEVKGAKLEKTAARLVLNFGQSMSYLFEGHVTEKEDGKGQIEVLVPPLPDVPTSGDAILEVIAGTHLLTPMKLGFKVDQGVKVTAKMESETIAEDDDIPTATIVFEDVPAKAAPRPVPVVKKRRKPIKKKTVNETTVEQVADGKVSVDDAIEALLKG